MEILNSPRGEEKSSPYEYLDMSRGSSVSSRFEVIFLFKQQ